MTSLFRFRTLGSRFFVLLLIPVCIIMAAGGTISFIYTRNTMLAQWNEGAILKLERAAHFMEMRLTAPLKMLDTLFRARASLSPGEILAALHSQEGVIRAEYRHTGPEPRSGFNHMMEMRMHFHRSGIAGISPPRFDASLGREALTVTVNLRDNTQSPAGVLKIRMGFDYLLEDMVRLGWWQSDMACIVDSDGRYLAHTNMTMTGRLRMGDRGDPLETAILERMKQETRGTVKSRGHPPQMVAGFYKLDQAPWAFVIYAKGRTVLAPIIHFRNGFALGILALSALILILIRHQTGQVARAIRLLSDRAGKIENGEYGRPIPVKGKDEISRLVKSFNDMARGLEERDFIRNSFGRYVDPEFARRLLEGSEAGVLGGERREVAILMSDIREFTRFSEKLSPEKTIRVLNLYFSRMVRIIQAHKGIIVDFFGDAILVFFDSPCRPAGDATACAFECACGMQEGMAEFNKEVAGLGLPGFDMGIGLHTGPVVVGNIGSDSRAKYGIVGSAVNLTARIQARAGRGEILASGTVREQLADRAETLGSQSVDLKGIQRPVTLYTLARNGKEPRKEISLDREYPGHGLN